MKIRLWVNHTERSYDTEASKPLRDVLFENGFCAVRDSDDYEAFCGSDTVLMDGVPVYSDLVPAALADGTWIVTPDGLRELALLNAAGKDVSRSFFEKESVSSAQKTALDQALMLNGKSGPDCLTVVQQAMIDAGLVQSAYNAPAAALMLTWLLIHFPSPSREQIKDAMSGIFIRDAGYEHYYLAVQLAKEKIETGSYQTEAAPSFRPHLRIVGKPAEKVDGPQLVRGEKVFVEDYVSKDACILVMLRSPHAHAYIKSIDTSEAEKVPGVVKIITAANCPDTFYMQAGQGNPEPSPHDRRLFNWKVRHVGDRVAGIVAETKEAGE